MKILKNTIMIISEIVVLILATLWYRSTCDYEPLIAIILSSVGLIGSLISRFVFRPKIELHHQKTESGRLTKGYTKNNPPIIRVGLDNPEQFWELYWNYTLEIRNNSSQDAYTIEIEYKNLPENAFINGEIGKIEPLLANDKREFKVKIVQNITGTHIHADEYLKTSIAELMKNAKILIKYKHESRITFYTEYDWSSDSNQFKIFK